MANFIYDSARAKFLNGDISWTRDTFRVVLLSGEYSASQSSDTALVHVKESSRIAFSGALDGKEVTAGVATANPVTVSGGPEGVPAGKTIRSLVIIRQNPGSVQDGADLIAYIDTAGGLSGGLSTQGNDVVIDWALDSSNNPKKVFKL